MAQNTSSAVMEQRAVRPPAALDYFPTPPWATRALCEYLPGLNWHLGRMVCWEPACGEGHMARPLGEYFRQVVASDVHQYGGHVLADFLLEMPAALTRPMDIDAIVTNPPFRLSLQFVDRALALSQGIVAMLVRSSWLESEGRYRALFAQRPPSVVLTFAERVVMLEGRLVRSGEPDPWNIDPKTGKPRKASTATSYSWVVWNKADGLNWDHKTRHGWVPPSRLQLERPGDYPDHSAKLAALETEIQNGLGL